MHHSANLVGGADWYPVRSATLPQRTSGSYISGLRESMTYRLAVQIYRTHFDPPDGACPQCGLPVPCPPRRHAAAVIEAAGEDPRRYDAWPFGGRHRGVDADPEDGLPSRGHSTMVDHPPLTWHAVRPGGLYQARRRFVDSNGAEPMDYPVVHDSRVRTAG